jgi:Protein of unknown function (DUF1566)
MTRGYAALIVAAICVLPTSCSKGGGAGGNSAATTQSIPTSGGTLTTPDGVTISVPVGALPSVTVLSAQAQPSAIPATGQLALEGGTAATGLVVGTPFVFGPEGQTFATPVTVTLPIQPAKLPAGTSAADVVIATAPAGGSTFTVLATTVVDATHVSALTSHFSLFVPVVPQVSGACGAFTMPNPVSTGLPNPASYTTDDAAGTISDNVTGLVWEKSPKPTTTQCTGKDDAGEFSASCTQSEAAAYCTGKGSGWRLPTRLELVSLVDFTAVSAGHSINAAFPSTPDGTFWTSSPMAGFPSTWWTVYFNNIGSTMGYAIVNDLDKMPNMFRVRCVRSMPKCYPMRFRVTQGEADGVTGPSTVYDAATGLTWQQGFNNCMFDATCPLTSNDAQAYCSTLSTLSPPGTQGGAWRVPSLTELQTIVDDTRTHPSIDPSTFPNTPSDWFLTSSANRPVDFASGGTPTLNPYSYHPFVRCVRVGSTTGSAGAGGTAGTGGGAGASGTGAGGAAGATDGGTDGGGAGGNGGGTDGGGAEGLDRSWAQWPMPNSETDVAAGAPNPQNYIDNGDGTVTDSVTGLMWQQTVPAATYTWAAAVAYCPTLTLASQDDWRLPSVIELVSIVDMGQFNPAINAIFPATPATSFWSSSPSFGFAWTVHFLIGAVDRLSMSGLIDVRCVRSSASAPAGRYTTASGTVYDTKTKLTWQQSDPSASYAWADAKTYCQNLGLGGADWRLPTMKELLTIVDYSRSNPSIDPTFSPPALSNALFWSSTPSANAPSFAMVVNFLSGVTLGQFTPDMYNVRCVR